MFAVILISLVFAAIGMTAIRAGIPDIKRALASRKWRKTDGLIEKISEESHLNKGRGRALISIEYKAEYHYIVDDVVYTGSWKSMLSTSNKPGMCPFRLGDVVDVYFNPENSSESRLNRGVGFQDAFVFSIGVVFLLASMIPMFVYLNVISDQNLQAQPDALHGYARALQSACELSVG